MSCLNDRHVPNISSHPNLYYLFVGIPMVIAPKPDVPKILPIGGSCSGLVIDTVVMAT